MAYLFSQDVGQEAVKEDCSNHTMKITVIHPNVAQENQDPVCVSVIIEGTEVLEDCRSVTNACLLLMGVIYAVNLSYPLKLKYTFEVFQKLFLELDILKMPAKKQETFSISLQCSVICAFVQHKQLRTNNWFTLCVSDFKCWFYIHSFCSDYLEIFSKGPET